MVDSNKKLIQRGVSIIAEVETAINEKAREEYVEAQDAVTLEAAKGYTDTREGVIRTDFAAADAATLTTSQAYTDTKVAALVDGAPETLDTLKEIADALKANEDGATAMLEVIGTKADAATTAAAFAEKVDKEEGRGLSSNDYTDSEREKLAGLDNYTLPIATATALGGVKIGDNLTVDADGRLNAPAGGGSGGGGASIYTIDFDLTEIDQQKAALDGLLAAYAMDPNVQVRLAAAPFFLTPVSASITNDFITIIANLIPPEEFSPTRMAVSMLIAASRSEAGEISAIEAWKSTEDILGGGGGSLPEVDYSPLGEQLVPGEFWRSLIDGSKKQVYIQTFTGTVDDSMSTPLLTGVEYAMPVTGYVMITQGEGAIGAVDSFRIPIGQVGGGQGFTMIGTYMGGVSGVYVSQNVYPSKAMPFILTVKYIK